MVYEFDIFKFNSFFKCETILLTWSLHFGTGILQVPSCVQNWHSPIHLFAVNWPVDDVYVLDIEAMP